MNGAAFWFGGAEPVIPYAEVTQIRNVEVNGVTVQKVLWGKRLPANFTNTYKTSCQSSSLWLNQLDFSKFTEIEANNFSELLHFMRADTKLMETLDFKELVSLGQNCFNAELMYTQTLRFPRLTSLRNCFNKITGCNRIESPTIRSITGPCFSGINSPYYPSFYMPELETISGSGVFCNLSAGGMNFTFPKLRNISSGNFQNVATVSSFFVSRNITSSSSSALRSALGSSGYAKVRKEG
nr:hypothetical protein [uncultured Campylobacter sp.]